MSKETWHHIIPTSRWWLKWIKNPNTILLKQVEIHSPLHSAFWNAFPNEQLLEILENPINIKKKIKNSKEEELRELLKLNSFEKIYLPEIITDLEDFYWKEWRVWKIKDEKKLIKYYKGFFKEEKTPEAQLIKMYKIAKSSLKSDFKEKLLNIIN